MKNKKIYLLVIVAFVLSLFLILPHANARVACTKNEINKLKNKAYKATLSYNFKKRDNGEHYFEIIIDNVEEGIEVRINNLTIGSGTSNNKIVIDEYFSEGEELVVDFYAEYGQPCVDQKLYSKKLTLPKYNYYSEREECIEYEEFVLCNKWYKGQIPDDSYFLEKLEEYKESLKAKNNNGNNLSEESDDNDFTIYIIAFAVIIVGIVVYLIKNRTKYRKIKKEINDVEKESEINENDINKNMNPNELNYRIDASYENKK